MFWSWDVLLNTYFDNLFKKVFSISNPTIENNIPKYLVIGLRFSLKIYIIRDVLSKKKKYQCCKKTNKTNVFDLKYRLSREYMCI